MMTRNARTCYASFLTKEADKLAEQGAKSKAPAVHLIQRERIPDPAETPPPYTPDEVFGLEDPWAELWDPREQHIPEEAWLDGVFDCKHADDYDDQEAPACSFDDPDVDHCHAPHICSQPPAHPGDKYARNVDPMLLMDTEVVGGMGPPPDELPSETSMTMEVSASSPGGGTRERGSG